MQKYTQGCDYTECSDGEDNDADGDTDYPDDYFDLTLAVDFFLHIPYDSIDTILDKVLRVTKKYLLILTWFVPDKTAWKERKASLASGNYLHNYPDLFSKLDSTLLVLNKNVVFEEHLYLLKKVV